MRSTIDWGRATRWMGLALLVTLAFGGVPRPADAKPTALPGVKLAPAWTGLTRPICVTHNGKDVFICEQTGKILRAAPGAAPTVYLDMTARVDSTGQGGVLCLAFHPQFAANGRFFVSYLAKGVGGAKFEYRVCEFQGTATAGNPASERPLIRVPKKRNTHQAGGIAFGPDGMLYVGIGDGMEKQPALQMVAQSEKSKLGKILRIDVSKPNVAGVPADNPWANLGGEFPLIWSYGYRNPWRFDWDAAKRLYTGEPGMKGAASREWIIEIKRGANGRWPYYEGDRKRAEVPGTPRAPATAPAFVYGGADTGGDNAVVGGRFYKGTRVPELTGKYVFCDYMQGAVYSLDLSSGKGTSWKILGKCKGPADVGVDPSGELYVCAIDAGVVYRISK